MVFQYKPKLWFLPLPCTTWYLDFILSHNLIAHYEDHTFISTSRTFELNPRSVWQPRKQCRLLICWKSLVYWLTLSVWPHMTSVLQRSSGDSLSAEQKVGVLGLCQSLSASVIFCNPVWWRPVCKTAHPPCLAGGHPLSWSLGRDRALW